MGAPSVAASGRSGRTVLSRSGSSKSGRSRSHSKVRTTDGFWTNKKTTGDIISGWFGSKSKKTIRGFVGDTTRKFAEGTHMKKKPKSWSKWTNETVSSVSEWTADWVPWAAEGIFGYCIPTVFIGTSTTLANAIGSAKRAYVSSAGLTTQASLVNEPERAEGYIQQEETYDGYEEEEEGEVSGGEDERGNETITRSSRRVRTPPPSGTPRRIIGQGHVNRGPRSDWDGWDGRSDIDNRSNRWSEVEVLSRPTSEDRYPHRVDISHIQHDQFNGTHKPLRRKHRSSGYDSDYDSAYFSDSEPRQTSWVPPPPEED